MKRQNNNARETVAAFRALAALVSKRLERVMRMKDGPAKDRHLLAIRNGMLVEDRKEAAVKRALHCARLASGSLRDLFYYPEPEIIPGPDSRFEYRDPKATHARAVDMLNAEPEVPAFDLAGAAEHLAIVIGAIVDELDAADAREQKAPRRAA